MRTMGIHEKFTYRIWGGCHGVTGGVGVVR
jgi:hypothetical protein